MSECIELGVFGGERAIELMKSGVLGSVFRVTAVCEPDSELRARLTPTLEANGASVLSSFTALLETLPEGASVLISGSVGERASRAVKALRAGFDVISEPPALLSLDEAYRLERAVRETNRAFLLGEYACFTRGVQLARELIKSGELGRVIAAETSDFAIRNDINRDVPTACLCTGALGSLLTATGLRPTRVTAMQTRRSRDSELTTRRVGPEAVLMLVGLSEGAASECVLGELAGGERSGLTIYCERGSIETRVGGVMLHDFSSGVRKSTLKRSDGVRLAGMKPSPRSELEYAQSLAFASFAARLRGEKPPFTVDIYRALDMSLPGQMAYRSLLDGSRTFDVPDLRREEGRRLCRADKLASPISPR